MGKVQTHSNSEYYTPASEPFLESKWQVIYKFGLVMQRVRQEWYYDNKTLHCYERASFAVLSHVPIHGYNTKQQKADVCME
jgi:hypothetical protein